MPSWTSRAGIGDEFERPPSPLTPSVMTGGCCSSRSRSGIAVGAALLDERALQGQRVAGRRRGRAAGLRADALHLVRVEVLEVLLDVGHELIGHGPVDQPVIEAERQVRHRPDRDPVVDDDRPLLDRADAEDRDLRLVDDRHAELRAELARDW